MERSRFSNTLTIPFFVVNEINILTTDTYGQVENVLDLCKALEPLLADSSKLIPLKGKS